MADWQVACGLRTAGSTVVRRQHVRNIFKAQIPVTESRSDRASEQWMDEIETLVARVVVQLQKEAELGGGDQLDLSWPSNQRLHRP